MNPVVKCLNDALQADRAAILALMSIRIPCNRQLADHATIVVTEPMEYEPKNCFTVSVLGLLNGVLESAGLPKVAAKYDKENGLVDFQEYVIPTMQQSSNPRTSKELQESESINVVKTKSIDVPIDVVDVVEEFLVKRKLNRNPQLVLGVALPKFDGIDCLAIYDFTKSEWGLLEQGERIVDGSE